MKRNYDSISHYSAGDKAEFSKLKALKEQYEKDIAALTLTNEALTLENKEYGEKNTFLDNTNKDLTKKLEGKTKEVDRLLAELKKKDKLHDDKLKSINSKSIFSSFFNPLQNKTLVCLNKPTNSKLRMLCLKKKFMKNRSSLTSQKTNLL